MADSNARTDIGAHEGTYSGFLGLMKWGTVAAAIVTFIVVLLIAS